MNSQMDHSLINMGQLQPQYKPVSRLEKLKDFLLNSAVVGSILYAAFLFYKVGSN